jgi:hypothetical protein
MDLKLTLQRFKHIYLYPKAEYRQILKETGRMDETFFVLFILCFAVGLSDMNNTDYRGNLFFETLIWLITIFLSSSIAWKLATKFGGTCTLSKSLTVNVYAISPLLLCIVLHNIIGYRAELVSVGFIYSIYLLYIGITIVFKQKRWKAVLYTFIMILIFALSNYISRIFIP